MSRLIDADAIKLPKGFFEKVNNVPKFYEWLNTMPTIDPVPQLKWERDTAVEQLQQLGYGLGEKVKRGRWMPYEFGDETWHKCSECNTADQYGYRYTAYDGKEHVFFAVRHYCPNCGARMEEVTE